MLAKFHTQLIRRTYRVARGRLPSVQLLRRNAVLLLEPMAPKCSSYYPGRSCSGRTSHNLISAYSMSLKQFLRSYLAAPQSSTGG